MNPDGSYNITSANIHDFENPFCPGRDKEIEKATEYLSSREKARFNRSRNICMCFVFGLCFALLAAGIIVEVF